MSLRIAIYKRYSSDLQNPTSIEDQGRLCRAYAKRNGWQVVAEFDEYEKSAGVGSLHTRTEINYLMARVMKGEFDIILSEAWDRIARTMEDGAGLYSRAKFARTRFVTVLEGEITPMHIAMKGFTAESYISDMGIKVKRGQEGRVLAGKIAAGNCYGYVVSKNVDAKGEIIRGERTINREHAKVINRIFKLYADGVSPKAIATLLNKEGIPGPVGAEWQPSTIYGNWHRLSGILRNPLYAGRYVWNRASYPKNPDTGKHVSRTNDLAVRVSADMPELRIVDDELWNRVQQRLNKTREQVSEGRKPFWAYQRSKYLLSHRLKCGCCDSGMSKISNLMYGCSAARNKGDTVCTNRRNIRQDQLEAAVLAALQNELMKPELLAVFCKEYTAHINRLRGQRNGDVAKHKRELEKLHQEERRIIEAIKNGFYNEALKREANFIEDRKSEIRRLLMDAPEEKIFLHPNMAEKYRKEVSKLVQALNDPKQFNEAAEYVRALIDKVVLTPDPDSDTDLTIDLYGDLAGILNIARTDKSSAPILEEDLKHFRMIVGPTDKVGGANNFSSTQPNRAVRRGKLVGPAGLEPATRPL
ncbi:recombinase family protein [Tardiphaga sp. 215_C5_N2_1]|uniref:recombinase family protein n=1 Tax=Tardiphaga sp. 215_C5_N2_1 TaxID=3240774 RepID=UPI003F8911B4